MELLLRNIFRAVTMLPSVAGIAPVLHSIGIAKPQQTPPHTYITNLEEKLLVVKVIFRFVEGHTVSQ